LASPALEGPGLDAGRGPTSILPERSLKNNEPPALHPCGRCGLTAQMPRG